MPRRRYDTSLFFRAIPLAAIAATTLLATAVRAQDDAPPAMLPNTTVTVDLRDGRSFHAFVDDRTDRNLLWLRFDRPAALIVRPIEWSVIRGVAIEGESIPQANWIERCSELRTHRGRLRQPIDKPPVVARPNETAKPALPRSIDADAWLANWDADADDDGLLLYVTPRDGHGQFVSTAGTLSTTLYGVTGRRRPSPSNQMRGVDDQRVLLDEWTHQLTDVNSDHRGYRVPLEFSTAHHALEPHVRLHGVLVVRLAIPGVGFLETTVDPVTLKRIEALGR